MEKPYVVGIDIGGTNTVFGVVDARGTILYSSSIKTGKYTDVDDYVIELQICYLMKISIPPTHIAIFTNRTKAAISNARTRLAKRLLGEQNSTEKLDAFISDLQ